MSSPARMTALSDLRTTIRSFGVIALLLLGILLPAALLVAAVRRWIAPVPWRIALLLMAMTLAFLHGAVFTSKLPVPVDEVARGYPWRGLFGDVVAANPLTNDTVKLFLPWMQVAREELAHGRAPLWNRYSFAGYPLLANGESAPFSPLFLATLIVPLPKQIVAMAALKIFAALLFTYLFLKREQASDAAAIFGAVVFAFSTVMTVFLYYSTASVVAFLPPPPSRCCTRSTSRRRPSIVFVALVIATLLANGHPESVLHIAIGCGAHSSARSRARRRSPRLAAPRSRAVIGVAAGLALGAPAWVPVLEQVRISERFATLRDAGTRARCRRSPRRGRSSARTVSAIRCATTGRGCTTTSAWPSRTPACCRWRSLLPPRICAAHGDARADADRARRAVLSRGDGLDRHRPRVQCHSAVQHRRERQAALRLHLSDRDRRGEGS